MRVLPLVLGLLSCSLLARPAAAQCDVEGEGLIESVVPIGTRLSLGITEEAEVRFEGRRARVRGVTPIAFEGRTRARDVHVALGQARIVSRVVRAERGVSVVAVRERDGALVVRLDAGAAHLVTAVPCSELTLDAPSESFADPGWPEPARWVRARAASLAVYSGPRGGRPVVLRVRRSRGEGLPDLAVLEAGGGTRLHIRAVLEEGVTLDGWVERASVSVAESFGGWGEAWPTTDGSACGHGFANTVYRGVATLAAGTELEDAEGVIWGHLVREASATVAIVSSGTYTRTGPNGETSSTHTETVWLDALMGLVTPPCSSLGILVQRSSVVLP